MKKYIFVVFLALVAFSANSREFEWTILDTNGNILHVIQNAEDVDPFNGEVFVVKYKNEFVFLDKNFAEVLRGSFELEDTGLYDDRIGFYDPASDKRGYLNGEGKVTIEPRFDYVGRFVYGHAVVGFGDSRKEFPLFTYRIIDTSGNYASPNGYSLLELSRFEPNKAFGKKKGEKLYQFFKFDGSIWQPVPTSVEFSFLKATIGFVIYRTKHGSGHGFVSWDGEILTEPKYDAITTRPSKFGAVVSMKGKGNFVVDRFGNPIEIEVEGTIWHIFDDRYVAFRDGDGAGIYDFIVKEVIIPPIYDGIFDYNEGIFNVYKDGKAGFINIQGNIVAGIIYDQLVYFNKGFGIGIKY